MRCQGCTERRVGCHTVCEYYLNFRQKREELRHRRHLEQVGTTAAIDNTLRHKHKQNRR